jgi:hypothetical protein
MPQLLECAPDDVRIASVIDDAVADLGVTAREVPVTPARLHALLARARAGAR